ncbi:ATP-binding cassette domain-containing protein [Arachidicoccus sp.]|jgi:ABC-2 type transport system ATP-binding protein|uniref:ABC transporter ATP-binding protein n=1 Tax=Arachidicoccus sp. TaxID=1872624 RepID=UPI003D1C067B
MINIENLHFTYKNTMVFDGLNLNFQAGKIYGLLGKNGTGKSTLFYNICGLLFPKRGCIKVMDYVPGERTPAFLQGISLIPEEFYLPDISIQNFIKNHSVFYPKYNQDQFDAYIREFQIPINNKLQQLSYGQKKKVLISFSLACNTSVVLMDEPTNGLDILSKRQFRKILAGVVDENKCIVISTHQVKDLESLIDQITIIDEGKILFNQSIDEIMNKLVFKFSHDKSDLLNALYAEESLTGNAIVTFNMKEETSKVDLEMLYKTVVTNGDSLRKIFN